MTDQPKQPVDREKAIRAGYSDYYENGHDKKIRPIAQETLNFFRAGAEYQAKQDAGEIERLKAENTMFAIGAAKYAGLAKIVEESGELLQAVGKLFASYGEPNHWDGTNLNERVEEEMADLNAALKFTISANPEFRSTVIGRRAIEKEALFNEWHKEQPPLPAALKENPNG